MHPAAPRDVFRGKPRSSLSGLTVCVYTFLPVQNLSGNTTTLEFFFQSAGTRMQIGKSGELAGRVSDAE